MMDEEVRKALAALRDAEALRDVEKIDNEIDEETRQARLNALIQTATDNEIDDDADPDGEAMLVAARAADALVEALATAVTAIEDEEHRAKCEGWWDEYTAESFRANHAVFANALPMAETLRDMLAGRLKDYGLRVGA